MKNLLIIFSLLFNTFSFAQTPLKAKIVNAESLNAIEFASILNLKTLEGTITDTLGFFVLDLPNNDDKLMIQSLGYKSDTFSVKEILNQGILKLEVNDFQISDVVVYPKSAFEIVRKAVLKIDENYDAETMAQNVFAREEIMANGELLGIRETNFNALSKFKNEDKANLVSINKARYFRDVDTLKNLGKMVASKLSNFDSTDIRQDAQQFFRMDILLSDNLDEDKTNLFGEKSLKFYKYNYNGVVEKDSFVAYHITFDQIDGLKKSLYKGHAYIDTATLGFIEIQIYASPKGLEYQKYIAKSMKMIMKLFGFSIYIKDMGYHLHYRMLKDKWVLDKAFSKLAAVISKKGYSYDGYMSFLVDVNNFYPKEDFYNKPSEYDKIDSDIEDFKDNQFFKGLHSIQNTSSSKFFK